MSASPFAILASAEAWEALRAALVRHEPEAAVQPADGDAHLAGGCGGEVVVGSGIGHEYTV